MVAAIPRPTDATSEPAKTTTRLTLGKYPFGIADRFAHQAQAQLRAWMLAAE